MDDSGHYDLMEGGARMLNVEEEAAARSSVLWGRTSPAGMSVGLLSRTPVSTTPATETTATTASSKSASSVDARDPQRVGRAGVGEEHQGNQDEEGDEGAHTVPLDAGTSENPSGGHGLASLRRLDGQVGGPITALSSGGVNELRDTYLWCQASTRPPQFWTGYYRIKGGPRAASNTRGEDL
jgi:hypothetical protein